MFSRVAAVGWREWVDLKYFAGRLGEGEGEGRFTKNLLGFWFESYWFEQEKSKCSVLTVLSLRCRFLCRAVKLDVWRWVLGEFRSINTKHTDDMYLKPCLGGRRSPKERRVIGT